LDNVLFELFGVCCKVKIWFDFCDTRNRVKELEKEKKTNFVTIRQ